MNHEHAPDGSGLLLSLDGGLRFVEGAHCDHIHRSLHVPASLQNARELSGGGSGVTIIAGETEDFGKVVIKHGGHQDTEELFALATIAEELRLRAELPGAAGAAAAMSDCIPAFAFMYISQHHLRELSTKKKPQNTNYKHASVCVGLPHLEGMAPATLANPIFSQAVSPTSLTAAKFSQISKGLTRAVSLNLKVTRHSSQKKLFTEDDVIDEKALAKIASNFTAPMPEVLREKRGITLCTAMGFPGDELNPDVCAQLRQDRLSIHASADIKAGKGEERYAYFEQLFRKLALLQEKNSWKFSLAQKQIGGTSPVTACALLAQGELGGEKCRTLIDEFLKVIKNLQRLTRAEEKEVVEVIRDELSFLKGLEHPVPADVSREADAYVGFAIKKNFDLTKGRFKKLRGMGILFCSDRLFQTMTEAERQPAKLLGTFLGPGVCSAGCPVIDCVSDVFEDGPLGVYDWADGHVYAGKTAFEVHSTTGTWLELLELAANLDLGKVACAGIWTGGLIDCGLHNLFLDSQRLWFFDLGAPSVMPLPAFLTKLLMSFFHALGMQNASDGKGWENRFEVAEDGRRVRLSPKSKHLLAKADEAFKETLRRFVKEVFHSDAMVCELLVRYTILQLMSDAAFCVNKWEVKGGGTERPRQDLIETWLWRALWDLYAASHVASKDWLAEVGIPRRQRSRLQGLLGGICSSDSSCCMAGLRPSF